MSNSFLEASQPARQTAEGDDNENENSASDVPNGTAPIIVPLVSPLASDDWHKNLPDNDHVRFFRSTDWSTTLLGPLKGWHLALRLHTFTLFADSRPACVYWGPGKTAIYNEHFAILAVCHFTENIKHILILLGRGTSGPHGLYLQSQLRRSLGR